MRYLLLLILLTGCASTQDARAIQIAKCLCASGTQEELAVLIKGKEGYNFTCSKNSKGTLASQVDLLVCDLGGN